MAYDLESGSNEFIQTENAVVSTTPFTVSARIKPESIGTGQTIWSVVTSSTANNYYSLDIAASGVIRFRARTTSSSDALSTAALSAGTEYVITAVAASATDRKIYINSSQDGSNTTSRAPSGMNRTTIGRQNTSTPANSFDGLVSEVAVWGAALTAGDIAQLVAGYSPALVRSDSLVSYMPLIRELTDIFGGYSWTATGGAVAPHPRVIWQVPSAVVIDPGAAGGTTHNETISDSVTAADSLSIAATCAVTTSDAVTAADSLTVSATCAATTSDNGTAADSLTVSATCAATTSDIGTVGDSLSVSATCTANISDIGTAGDSLSVAATCNATTSDALTAEDDYLDEIVGGGQTYNESFTESLSASDSLAVTVQAAATVSESLTASDSLAATAECSATTSESLTASESLSVGRVTSDAVSFSVTADDSLSGAAVFSTSLSETVSATDALAALATINAATTDTLSAVDNVAALATFNDAIESLLSAAYSAESLLGYLPQGVTLLWEAPRIKLHWVAQEEEQLHYTAGQPIHYTAPQSRLHYWARGRLHWTAEDNG